MTILGALDSYLLSAQANRSETRFKFDVAGDETTEIKAIASGFDERAKAILKDKRLTRAPSRPRCRLLALSPGRGIFEPGTPSPRAGQRRRPLCDVPHAVANLHGHR